MTAPHSHVGFSVEGATKRLGISLVLTLAFVVVEAVAAFWANSLVLLTDAAHNFTDVVALALSWYAMRLATRPADSGKTYGYHRAGILVALANSTTLVVVALGIFYEAYRRLLSPPHVDATVLTFVAAVAFAVNAGTALLVRKGSRSDLNMRSAFLHLAGDAVSSFAAIVTGVAMTLTGIEWLDPVASMLIGLMIVWNGWRVARETVHILLESSPSDVDMKEMVRDLSRIDGVRGVHDLHVWSITRAMRALSAHVVTDDVPISAGAAIQAQIRGVLLSKYGIAHATIQLECPGCAPNSLYCDFGEAGSEHDSKQD